MTVTDETRERLIKRADGDYASEDGRFLVSKNDRGYGYTIEDRERWVARYGYSNQAIGRLLPHCEPRDWVVNTLADARESVAKWRDQPEGPDAGYHNMLDAIAAKGDEGPRYKMSDNPALNLAHIVERMAAGDTSPETIRRARDEARKVRRSALRD